MVTQQAREWQFWNLNPGPPDFKVYSSFPPPNSIAGTKGRYSSVSMTAPTKTSQVNKSRSTPSWEPQVPHL